MQLWLRTLLLGDLGLDVEVDQCDQDIAKNVETADIGDGLWVIPWQLLGELGHDQDNGHVGAMRAVSKLCAPLIDGRSLTFEGKP